MAYKQFALNPQTKVTIYKRRKARSLKLTVTASGQVKISIPTWASYQTGLNFAKSRESWIIDHALSLPLLMPDQAVGKAHHLQFIAKQNQIKVSCRVTNNIVAVTHPLTHSPSDPNVQNVAIKGCQKALRLQAERLLPQRLTSLAEQSGYSFKSVSVRHLKSRWGSCDQDKNIVLSLFLMQLPWKLIDYVLLHELTHTKVLKHGPSFWEAFETLLPGAKSLKRELRTFKPVINNSVV